MNVLYITNSRLPTEKAHGVQIAKMCEALIEQGTKLLLVIPKRNNPIKETIENYYGLRVKIPTKKLWTIDLLSLGFLDTLSAPLQALTFYLGVLAVTLKDRKTPIFTRDQYSPLFCLNKSRVIWEIHELPKTAFGLWLLTVLASKCQAIICVNKAVWSFFAKSLKPTKIFLLPNAVDPAIFASVTSPEETRKMFSLPQDKKLVIYTGSFYRRKGVYTLVEAVRSLPKNFYLALFGGPEEERTKLQSFVSKKGVGDRVKVFANVPYPQIPSILLASDVLVLPNSSLDITTSEQTSPLKFYEYFASGRPMVVSDVPSIRRLGQARQLLFFSSDNLEDLAKKVTTAVDRKGKDPLPKRFTTAFRAKEIIRIYQN